MASSGFRGNGEMFRLTTGLTLSTKSKAFSDVSDKALRNATTELGKRAQQYARENVEPGKGPSIHPHDRHIWHTFKWEDTGDLAESVQVRFRQAGFLRHVVIETDSDYRMWLELGFHGPSGRMYRYPWMRPAFAKAQKELPIFAAQALKQAIEELNRASTVVYKEDQIQRMIKDAGDQRQKFINDEYNDEEVRDTFDIMQMPNQPGASANLKIRSRKVRARYGLTPNLKKITPKTVKVQDTTQGLIERLRKAKGTNMTFRRSKRTKNGRPIIIYKDKLD
jgi:hypothetical protein